MQKRRRWEVEQQEEKRVEGMHTEQGNNQDRNVSGSWGVSLLFLQIEMLRREIERKRERKEERKVTSRDEECDKHISLMIFITTILVYLFLFHVPSLTFPLFFLFSLSFLQPETHSPSLNTNSPVMNLFMHSRMWLLVGRIKKNQYDEMWDWPEKS